MEEYIPIQAVRRGMGTFPSDGVHRFPHYKTLINTKPYCFGKSAKQKEETKLDKIYYLHFLFLILTLFNRICLFVL